MLQRRKGRLQFPLNPTAARFALPGRPAEELYDVAVDPHQVRNLVGDPQRANELQRHRDLLEEWSRQHGDHATDGFSEQDLLGTLLLRKEECVDPEFAAMRARHASLIERYPEQWLWKQGEHGEDAP